MEELARQHGPALTRLDAIPVVSDFMLRLRDAYKGTAFSGCVAGDGRLSPMEKLVRQCNLALIHLVITPAASDLMLCSHSALKRATFSGCVASDGPLPPPVPPHRPRAASPLAWQTPTAPPSPPRRRRRRRSSSVERQHDHSHPESPRRSRRAVSFGRCSLALTGASDSTRHVTPAPPTTLIFNTRRSTDQQPGLVAALLVENSPYALRPAGPAVLTADCAAIDLLVAIGPAQSAWRRGEGVPWTRWLVHCAERQTVQWRFDVAANSGVDLPGQHREAVLMARFITAVAFDIKPRSSAAESAKPQRIMANLNAVQRLHKAKGFPMPPNSLPDQVLAGMMRSYVERHGQEPLLPNRKEPFSRREVLKLPTPPDGTQLDNLRLRWTSLGGVALQVLLQT